MGIKNTVTILFIGLVVGAALGYAFCLDNPSAQSRTAELARENTALHSQVTELQAQLAEARKRQAAASDFGFLADSFSRTADTSAVLKSWISRANGTISVAIYSFTSDSLGDALVAAEKRGVDVRVYVEGENADGSGSEYQKLIAAGVSVKTDARSALMHHKFMVVDGKVVATGSYNWTASAEDSNDENLLVVRSTFLAGDYSAEFSRLWAQG